MNPDCENDKHRACPGWTWSEKLEREIECECPCHAGGSGL